MGWGLVGMGAVLRAGWARARSCGAVDDGGGGCGADLAARPLDVVEAEAELLQALQLESLGARRRLRQPRGRRRRALAALLQR